MRQSVLYNLLLLLLLCLTACGAEAPPEKGAFKGGKAVVIPAFFKQSFLDIKADVDEATDENKRVMVYFHQNSCPYCAKLVNENFTDPDIVAYMGKNIDAVDINMFGDRAVTDIDGNEYNEKEYAEKLKVWFTPTLLFFNAQGETILRVNGYYPKDKFMAALQYVAEKQETKISFTDYYNQKFATVGGALIDEPFFVKSKTNFEQLSKESKPLAVFFEQAQCDDCTRMHNVALKDADTLAVINQFNVVQLARHSDTRITTPDGKEMTVKQWADSLAINYSPSVVLYDQRKEVIRIEAFLKTFHVQSVFDYVLSGEYKTEPSFQRYIEHRADVIRNTGKTVDIWN